MIKIAVLAMICCSLALGGCATCDSMAPRQEQLSPAPLQAELILRRANLSDDEKKALSIGLGEFERFLEERFGRSKLMLLNERIIQSSDLDESLKETYGFNLMLLWSDFHRRPSREDRPVSAEWLTSSSDHFVFHYHPGSSAERDIGIIVNEAESALIGVCAAFGFSLDQLESKLNMLEETHDSLSGLYYVKGGKRVSTDGRIVVVLTEGLKEFRKLGGPKYSSGANLFSARGTFDGLNYSNPLIFLYLDVFNLIVLNHEIVHAVHKLSFAAEADVWRDYLKERMDSEGETTVIAGDDFHTLVSPMNRDMYLSEGLATFYSSQYGLIPRAIHIPAMRDMVADVMPTWKGASLRYIIEWKKISLSFFEKVMTVLGKERYVRRDAQILYLGGSCFVEYLLAEYGPDKLFMLISCTKGSDCVCDVFGKNIEEMDQSWNQWIKTPSRESS